MSENSRQSQSHIDSIVRQEEEALERRASSDRLADAGGGCEARLFFVVFHLALVSAWLLVNSGKIPGARPFDPYPFSLLGVIVAVEAVILSSFILMRQNRMMRRGAPQSYRCLSALRPSRPRFRPFQQLPVPCRLRCRLRRSCERSLLGHARLHGLWRREVPRR